jgi:two-component system sensor histidine kinase YesM
VFKSIISYEKKEDSGIRTYIYSSEGDLIYPYLTDESDQEFYNSYYNIIKEGSQSNQHTNPRTGEKEYLVYETSPYSEWIYLSVQMESVVLQPVTSLVKLIVITVGIIFILALAVSYLLSKNMIKPIVKLKEIFQKQAIDTLGEKVNEDHYTSYSELAEVYKDYNIMNEKLRDSMHELIESRNHEIKARMSALQAQTNPHFFYNTLSSIIVLSENGQNDEIVQLCRNLTKLMRYITDNYVTKVKIKEELEYVQKYLYCMKVRYQSSLEFEYDIDKKLYDITIPKLVIQPLVENAIKHGTDCLPPWKIKITGKILASGWTLNVSDSGNGFNPETLRNLKEKMNNFKITYDTPPA